MLTRFEYSSTPTYSVEASDGEASASASVGDPGRKSSSRKSSSSGIWFCADGTDGGRLRPLLVAPLAAAASPFGWNSDENLTNFSTQEIRSSAAVLERMISP